DPPQPSEMSHSAAAGGQMTPIGRNTSGGRVELTPVHTSSASQTSPEPARQTVPALPAACWQALFVPSHRSVVQTLPSSVHAVPDGVLASAGQLGPLPVHISAGSHSPAEPRQTTKLGSNMSAGQVLLVPAHISPTSHPPAAAFRVAPALPAACWQASLVPLHVSLVHGLPSSVHAVPLGCLASAEQLALLPGQKSSASHSSTAARQSTVEDLNASFGHVELLPVQVSATSQMPAAARQVAPPLPAGCWQALLVPLQVSLVLGLPSSVQAVPLATFASAEPLGRVPGQDSSCLI